MFDQPVHEVAVVRHHDEAAGVIEQELFKDLEGEDVQIVRRLIEDQDVRVAHQHLQQVQPLLFAPAQHPYIGVVGVAREEEAFEEVGGEQLCAFLQGHELRDGTHGLEDPHLFGKLRAVLVEVTEDHRFSDDDFAAGGF